MNKKELLIENLINLFEEGNEQQENMNEVLYRIFLLNSKLGKRKNIKNDNGGK